LLVVVREKKKKGEKGKKKQKMMPNKKMSTRFEDIKNEYRKIKIENEYNLNTNQTGPKCLH